MKNIKLKKHEHKPLTEYENLISKTKVKKSKSELVTFLKRKHVKQIPKTKKGIETKAKKLKIRITKDKTVSVTEIKKLYSRLEKNTQVLVEFSNMGHKHYVSQLIVPQKMTKQYAKKKLKELLDSIFIQQRKDSKSKKNNRILSVQVRKIK